MTDMVQKTLEEIDNYEQTVNATLAMLHLFKFDDETMSIDNSINAWFGKKMKPGDLTPDLIIQLNSEKGIITEIKRSLPRNDAEGNDLWEEEFKQIKSYDQDLEGWETPSGKIKNQDLILLISQKIGVNVCDYIDEKKLVFTDFSKNFLVLEFNPQSGVRQAVFLRKVKGEITEFKRVTNQRLRSGIPIALEYLFKSGLSEVKFVDYKPNVVYLMSLLWDLVFSIMPTDDDWRNARESKGGKIVEIPVKVEQLKEILNQNFTLDGQNGIVKEEWIQEALEKLVELKLAKREAVRGEYIIKYRKKIKDEQDGTNKQKAFAELLFKEGVQTDLTPN